jgi:two-component system, NtrC family, sensor kinase
MKLIPLVAIAIYGIFALRKLLETPKRLPVWDKFLSKVWIGSVVFLAVSFYPPLQFIADWYIKLVYVIVFITVYLLRNYRPAIFDSSKSVSNDRVYLIRNYRPARLLSISLLPIGIVYLIRNFFSFFAPDFFKTYATTFNSAVGFAGFWLIGFGVYAIVQIKKEGKLRAKLQEESQIAEARKAELEQLVTERTNQLSLQNEKLATALAELKSTQAQLIQSEKMASLGELTAGIAHEIQNPLNFVNNFSEINEELLIEMKDELSKGKIEDAIVLANDAIENQKKIYHHGKRADAIVKGMLQHSRRSNGIKEPTDINALADEYLRLSYHGLRAKDKSFNAILKTDFDETIGKINIIPQDIGRVILNLITNAFYAASLPSPEKIGTGAGGFSDPDNIKQPTVTVSTSKNPPLASGGRGADVLISVRDNGPGIPQNIIDKIFQPFFTTKPTGQGTGLGLSLSYDIVKAHGGELRVETKDGEGSVFTILLPM